MKTKKQLLELLDAWKKYDKKPLHETLRNLVHSWTGFRHQKHPKTISERNAKWNAKQNLKKPLINFKWHPKQILNKALNEIQTETLKKR